MGVEESLDGTRSDTLKAVRLQLARCIDSGVAARDLAPLSRRILEIDQELRNLAEGTDFTDGLEAARQMTDEAFTPYD